MIMTLSIEARNAYSQLGDDRGDAGHGNYGIAVKHLQSTQVRDSRCCRTLWSTAEATSRAAVYSGNLAILELYQFEVVASSEIVQTVQHSAACFLLWKPSRSTRIMASFS